MEFEYIEHRKGFPFKLFLVSIGYRSHHFHAELEVIYVLKGTIRIQLTQNRYIIQEGQLFLINPYEIHSIENLSDDENENNILMIIQITTQAYILNKMRLSQIHFSDSVINEDKETLIQTLLLMQNKSVQLLPGTEYHLNGLLQIFIGNLLDVVPYVICDQRNLRNQSDEFKRLEFIIDYVEENFRNKLFLEELADKLHISKYHLSHFIKHHLGISFQTYLSNVRLANAISLLANTEQSILEISNSSGFSDQKYMNALIKGKYNCTANILRKSVRQQTNAVSISGTVGSVHLPFDLERAVAIIGERQQHCPIISTTL